MTKFVLITGIPRAGKSSFADALGAQNSGFTHIPLDKYIKPIPTSLEFLDWVATPACIDWDLLLAHIKILESGSHCYTPQADWNASGKRISHGGSLSDAPGRLMQPASRAYLIPGSHAFSFPARAVDVFRIFMNTPESIIAQRFIGSPVDGERVNEIIREYLGENPKFILNQSSLADLILDGTAARDDQVSQFLDVFHLKFPDI